MDEQFKNLKPDMDEIEARAYEPRTAKKPIETGPAIVMAAIILVLGLWGGKLFYDHVQEQRVKAALAQIAKSLGSSLQQSNQQTQKAMLMNQRKIEQWKAQQEIDESKRQATRQAQITQASQDLRLQTPECRFWWEQHANDPSTRNEAKKKQHCNL
jgi:uncharacterized protein HemX